MLTSTFWKTVRGKSTKNWTKSTNWKKSFVCLGKNNVSENRDLYKLIKFISNE